MREMISLISGELIFEFFKHKIVGCSSVFTRNNEGVTKMNEIIIYMRHWKDIFDSIDGATFNIFTENNT